MNELFASGHVVDLILGLMTIEALLLLAYHRRAARGIAPADLAVNLLSGICLLLAVRAALVGADWSWVALALSASLFGHLADLRRRWRSE